jgi:hypothetical protein
LAEAGIEYREWNPRQRRVEVDELKGVDKKNAPLESLRTNLESPDKAATNLIFPRGIAGTFATLAEGLDVRLVEVVKGISLESAEVKAGQKRVRIQTDKGVFSANWIVCALPLRELDLSSVLYGSY